MRRVIVESPYAGKTPEETRANVEYARLCVRDCVLRGEAPIASHLLFTQPGILDDTKPDERGLGMRAGLAWSDVADAHVVYVDRGVSSGMRAGMTRAAKMGKVVEERRLGQAAVSAATEPRDVPTPEELRDLLLAAGIDVGLPELVNAIKHPSQVAEVAAWARAKVEFDQGPTERAPVPPAWLSAMVEATWAGTCKVVEKKAQAGS